MFMKNNRPAIENTDFITETVSVSLHLVALDKFLSPHTISPVSDATNNSEREG